MRGYIKQSTYQKKVEEVKKLKADLKVICFDTDFPKQCIVISKWRKYFETEDDFVNALREYANTLKNVPHKTTIYKSSKKKMY